VKPARRMEFGMAVLVAAVRNTIVRIVITDDG
jgi:hypothetical protein